MTTHADDARAPRWTVGTWTAVGVLLGVVLQVGIAIYNYGSMNAQMADMQMRVAALEQQKVDKDTISPQLEEINRRLGNIEASISNPPAHPGK